MLKQVNKTKILFELATYPTDPSYCVIYIYYHMIHKIN